ncbi:MAG: septal ring lytic transglycosylase RlpA family protein, partial [Treponema sp.]|nr:septal ring lytic transglycosylase RlpA family protein [Treponema sp.]
MKSIFLALLGFFLCLSIAAQAVPGTLSQNAQVLLELQVDGIHASHPDLPSGTEATITNEANGKTITVITSDRMPRSSGRVVNLSPAAARELEAGKGDWVKITIYNQRPLTTPNAQNTETHTNAQGNTVINNYYYIFDPDKLPDLANKVVDPNTARLDEILQNKTKDLES